jgi:nucleotide exchange factor SIL1
MSLTVAICLSLCYSQVATGETSNTELESNEDDDEVLTEELDSEDLEVFTPTNQWQTVGNNQAIPPGLHVRMNLATGHKEAKLLDPKDAVQDTEMVKTSEKEEPSDDESLSVPRGQRPGIINTKRMPFTVEQAREALRKIKDESPTDENGMDSVPLALPDASSREKKKLSAEEMEQVLEVLGLKMRSEVEIMAQHVDTLVDQKSTDEQRLHALNELEYYVHQIDNARDLNIIGGLVVVVRCLNDSDVKIREAAALVLGAAAQSNQQVQTDCLEHDSLKLLLERLKVENDDVVRKRLVFAISSMVRQFHLAQKELVKLGGVDVLSGLLNGSDCGEGRACQQLALKALTLMTDLLVEHSPNGVLMAQSKITSEFGVELLGELVSNGWCSHVPRLLKPDDTDVSEKVLQAMQMLVHACGNEFASNDVIEQLETIGRQWKGLARNEDQYYKSLIQLTTQFLEQIVKCRQKKDCSL